MKICNLMFNLQFRFPVYHPLKVLGGSRKMKRVFSIVPLIVLLFATCPGVFAQGDISEQPKVLLRNEESFGLFLNSNGLGGDFEYAKRINARNHILYRAELSGVKAPKEIKISNGYYSNKSFVFGKQNSFFEFKAQYGRQSELFRKNDVGGISIRYFYTVGPTLGILKPIYYEILYTTGSIYDTYSKIEKFNTTIHQTQILGKASFFEGMKELSFVPGASARLGFTFEYSRQDIVLHALEFGIGMDVYPKKIPIMATDLNNFYFLTLFVGYRFGKVIDMSEAARANNWFDKLKEEHKQQKLERQQKKAAKDQPDY